ncbi:polyprenyl synthetase family protein [Actinokineospora terrae]|uniref:Geranylgeranyl diphosphate synthase, type I n=1 Tax=Actinokineospora terrae TaxID=155974 RepID=A0A1H9NM35_9PSEU|nr:polyprenyl synthetase family protein [Actinokineospora terrae]SER37008.1 geranylgeranyl diphosphate synthase, type I [Actinokineospora terrae]
MDGALAVHVERNLSDYLEQRRAGMAEMAPSFGSAVESLAAFVLGGGKRIRPTFAWWAWRGAGGAGSGPEAEAVLRAVSALELIQACALVHDDLMDDSAVRRGKPTVHVEFAARHRERGWLGTPERFGAAAAILLGDLALAWADDMYVSAELPADRRAAALVPWQAMRAEMLAGQYLDVLTQAKGDESAAASLSVARMKTAAYTVERPLHMGAALAGADERLVAALRAFGADIGLAFQLRDDLLGMYGDTDVTGKPAGDDLREGKRTLLMSIGLGKADAAGRATDAALMRSALGNDNLDSATVERTRELLVDLGAVAEVECRIGELTESAMRALGGVDLAEPAGDVLAGLAVSATKRAS